MAIANEMMVGRYNRFAQKHFGMKGPASVNQVSGEIGLTLPIFAGNESALHQGWDRFGLSQTMTIAANQGNSKLRNPAASNVIALIDKLIISATVATNLNVQFGANATDLTTIQQGVRLDARARPNSTCQYSFNIANAPIFFGGSIYNVDLPASSSFELIGDNDSSLPLLPGDAIQVNCPAAFTGTFRTMIHWRERYLEESELK